MKKTAVALFVWCLAAVPLPRAEGAQLPSAPQAAAETGSIRGRVTAADTGRPLRRALISLAPASVTPANRATLEAHTNSLGQFEVKEVPPGLYVASASRAGYISVQYGQRAPLEKGLSIEVTAGRAVEKVDFVMPRAGVLAGMVVDEMGGPYPGVYVGALQLRYSRGQRQPFPAGSARTDDLGRFRIGGLQPGSYYVVANSSETWLDEKRQSWGYATTYYPGVPLERAGVVNLKTSEARFDLNITLTAAKTARLAGRLVRETGAPVAGSGVSLAYGYPDFILTYGMRTTRAGPDGAFAFEGVPPGTYSVGGGGGASEMVAVSGTDIDDVLLVARTGSTVWGSLVIEDGSPPPFGTSGVRILLEAPVGRVLPTVRVVSVDKDWSFRLAGLGGPFLFRVTGLPEGWMLRSVRVSDRDITDEPWDVPTGGREIKGLQVMITSNIGRVSGLVVDADGEPASTATVVLFPEDSSLWLPGSRFIRATRPGTDGLFSIEGLPGGTYYAVAREFVESGQWEDASFLEEIRGTAARIVLLEGGTENVTLKLPAR